MTIDLEDEPVAHQSLQDLAGLRDRGSRSFRGPLERQPFVAAFVDSRLGAAQGETPFALGAVVDDQKLIDAGAGHGELPDGLEASGFTGLKQLSPHLEKFTLQGLVRKECGAGRSQRGAKSVGRRDPEIGLELATAL